MVYARDSKSLEGNLVPVQVRPRAPSDSKPPSYKLGGFLCGWKTCIAEQNDESIVWKKWPVSLHKRTVDRKGPINPIASKHVSHLLSAWNRIIEHRHAADEEITLSAIWGKYLMYADDRLDVNYLKSDQNDIICDHQAFPMSKRKISF